MGNGRTKSFRRRKKRSWLESPWLIPALAAAGIAGWFGSGSVPEPSSLMSMASFTSAYSKCTLGSRTCVVHGDTAEAIAAGFVLINTAESFVSPKRNNFPIGLMPEAVTVHNQPRDAMLAFGKVKELPRRSSSSDSGFDAMAVGFVSCQNDGSQVTVAKDYVKSQSDFRYDEFIRRLAVLVDSRL